MEASLRGLSTSEIDKVWEEVGGKAKRPKEEYVKELEHYLELAKIVGRKLTGWRSVSSSYISSLRKYAGYQYEREEVLAEFFTEEPLVEMAEFFSTNRTFPPKLDVKTIGFPKVTLTKDGATVMAKKGEPCYCSYENITFKEDSKHPNLFLEMSLCDVHARLDKSYGTLLANYIQQVKEEQERERLAEIIVKKLQTSMPKEGLESAIEKEVEKALPKPITPPLPPLGKKAKSKEEEINEAAALMFFGFFFTVITYWSYVNPEMFIALFGLLSGLSFLLALFLPLSLLLLIILILLLIAVFVGGKESLGVAAVIVGLFLFPFLIFGGILFFGLQGMRTIMMLVSVAFWIAGFIKLFKAYATKKEKTREEIEREFAEKWKKQLKKG